jgi:hypothetical protein
MTFKPMSNRQTSPEDRKRIATLGGKACSAKHGSDYYRELAKKSHQARKDVMGGEAYLKMMREMASKGGKARKRGPLRQSS